MSKEKIEAYLENRMTVGELRQLLEGIDDDTKVVFAFNYGDYWRTTVAEYIRDLEVQKVYWSEYHDKLKIDEESDDIESDGELSVEVLVIR